MILPCRHHYFEWMGYALLYESMLDSVLRARDRSFVQKGDGSKSVRMVLGLCEGSEIFKDRVGFWNDVYVRVILDTSYHDLTCFV